MRVPVSWLREYVELPAGTTSASIAQALIRAGLEVERVESVGADLSGPIIVGAVREITDLTEFKKPIRYCQVEVGAGDVRGIICGATNFAVNDHVVVSLPGSVLPGGFEITARETYGHVSNGMICSVRELGIGDDHAGILVLPADTTIGTDAVELLGLRDEILDIGVTPDRGYCESVRGVARETSHAFAAPFRDPAVAEAIDVGAGWPVRIDDLDGCDRFGALTVTGLDPQAASPVWMQQRLHLCGVRPVSLAVDVTNYVMLELGQPMHAYDAAQLAGPIVVRRARPGERIATLDEADRVLDDTDIVVTDDSGPIGIGGVMGGASTEISPSTVDIVLEAAHWDPPSVRHTVRRQKLPSEAARRFERYVDPEIGDAALQRAAALLTEHGGTKVTGYTSVGVAHEATAVRMRANLPARTAGVAYAAGVSAQRLTEIGCTVTTDGDELVVLPPSWRDDLRDPADLVEEVVRLEGYDEIESELPLAPPGRGLTAAQRNRRAIGRALAASGLFEVLSSPFLGESAFDAFGLAADDPRRSAVRLLNPLSGAEPLLRTTLLPGLLATLRRNVGRGQPDVALYELGLIYLQRAAESRAPVPPVDNAPSAAELAAMDDALPTQPWHVAAVFCGERDAGRPADWSDAVAAVHAVARAARVDVTVRAATYEPWHPGRCAEFLVGDTVVGHAGELHPRVVAALELPRRTCATELDLDALGYAQNPADAPEVSAYPPALLDIAVVVDDTVPAAAVTEALRSGAGELLEELRLFDVYVGDQLGAGKRSLAYGMRFRAPDRTLTAEEIMAARDAALAAAENATGATLRS